MDEESYAVIEEILRDDEESRRINYTPAVKSDDQQWQTVSYTRRRNKPSEKFQNIDSSGSGDVFRPIEEHAAERRRRIEAEATEIENSVPEMNGGGEVSDSGPDGDVAKKADVVAKVKKDKEPKVSVVDVATKIDASDLAAFLADITLSYEKQEDVQLMRFADYLGRAFATVSASQFPWVKALKESSVSKMMDIPLSLIPEDVYKTSTEWLKQRSLEALGSFVLWLWDSILADLEIHQGSAQGSKRAVQHGPLKSQVAIFMVLAMALRGKPEVLTSLMPTLRDTSKYQGQDKLRVTVWLISQAYQGDLAVGLFTWANLLLPMLNSKPSCNPQSRDLILQLVERILASPKAGRILQIGVVRKGERLVSPTAFELLVRATFPASSARVKATERLEALYPTLKKVALSGPPGSKVMKQVTQFAVKAAGEGVPELSNEAINLVVWCLTYHPDSCKQWDELYLDNLEASVLVLKKLSSEWNDYNAKVTCVEPLKATLKNFKKKNEKALAAEEDGARLALLNDAEKLRKLLMARLSKSRHTCIKGTVFISVAVALGAAAAVVMSHDTDSWDLKKLVAGFV